MECLGNVPRHPHPAAALELHMQFSTGPSHVHYYLSEITLQLVADSAAKLIDEEPVLHRALSPRFLGAVLEGRLVKLGRVKRALWISPGAHDIAPHLRNLVSDIAQQGRHIERDSRVDLGATPDSCFGNVISADTVAQQHVEGRRRAALFIVALNGDSIQALPPEQETLDLVRVAVVVEVDGPVRGKEAVKLSRGKGVRVHSLGL